MTQVLERTQSLYDQAREAELKELGTQVFNRLVTEIKPLRELLALQTGLLSRKQVMWILHMRPEELQLIDPTLKPIEKGNKYLYNPERVLEWIHKNEGKRIPGREANRDARKRLFELRKG